MNKLQKLKLSWINLRKSLDRGNDRETSDRMKDVLSPEWLIRIKHYIKQIAERDFLYLCQFCRQREQNVSYFY